MGFFRNQKIKRNLFRAKKDLLGNPSPTAAASLVSAFVAAGEVDNALEIARQGVEIYPRSPSLNSAFNRLNKVRYQEEIKSLQAEITSRPSPYAYEKLANLFFDLNETDKALDCCRQGSQRFPDYEGNYLIVGKIRYQHFKEDGLAKDGIMATDYFEQALALNPENPRTLLQLTEIYFELGAVNKAIGLLDSVRHLAPDDERAKQLERYAKDLPRVAETSLESMFEDLEKKRKSTSQLNSNEDPDSRALSRFSNELEEFRDKLAVFQRNSEEFLAAAVFRKTGEMITSLITWDIDEETFGAALRDIFLAAQKTSLKLDIGSIDRAVVETSTFQVHFFTFSYLTFFLMVSPKAKSQVVEVVINDFIDKELYAV